ncbi:MAG: hypothetical protein ACPGLY_12055 [Rubripirellula sp.]
MRILTDLSHTESGVPEPLPTAGRRPLVASLILQLLLLQRINKSLAQLHRTSAKRPKTLQKTALERQNPRRGDQRFFALVRLAPSAILRLLAE